MFKFISNLFSTKKPPRLVLPQHTQAVPAPLEPPPSATAPGPKATAGSDKASGKKPPEEARPAPPPADHAGGKQTKKSEEKAPPAKAVFKPVTAPVAAPIVGPAPAVPTVVPAVVPVAQKAITAPAPVVEPAPAKPADAREEWAKRAAARLDTNADPEALCGITANMSKDEISTLLAQLYRRHNRAASSLDGNLREEAEAMLDIIASMREKYLDR